MNKFNEYFNILTNYGPLSIRISGITARFDVILEYIESKDIAPREKALVKTKLEEACYFAIQGLVINLIKENEKKRI